MRGLAHCLVVPKCWVFPTSIVGAGLMVLSAVFAPHATAKDEPDPLRAAEKLVKADKAVEAMSVYAAELAVAQKKGDILRQQDVVRAIAEHVTGSHLRKPEIRLAIMRTLMMGLDPKKAYAFCYAGGLANNLLHEMTLTADRTSLPDARKICALQIKRKGAGVYERAMLSYADGLTGVNGGDEVAGLRGLGEAFEAARENGWAYTQMCAGTELAIALLAKGDKDRAARAIRLVGEIMGQRRDIGLSGAWVKLIKARMGDAPTDVLAAYTNFMKTDPLQVTGKATPENKKSSGVSMLGEQWRKLSKSSPFATVTRKGSDFEVWFAFDKKREDKHAFQGGVTQYYYGGVAFSFWDNRVRLAVADPDGWRSIPNIAAMPNPLLTFTPLRHGTIWGANKKGELIVKHPKK